MKKGRKKRKLHKKMQNNKSRVGTQEKRVLERREAKRHSIRQKCNKEEIRKANTVDISMGQLEKEMFGGKL